MNERTWQKMQLRRLAYLYGQYVKLWEGRYKDDRGVLCLTYRQMEAALKSLPAEPTAYVKAAMEERMRTDRARMDKIVKRHAAEFWKAGERA